MEDGRLIEFTKEFFKSLGCEISEEKDCLVVKNVPEKFEKYYGKSAPYKIIFSREEEENGFDVVTKGSYLLKAMTSYLDKSGETTLLKIDFQVNPEEEIKKKDKAFKLRNSPAFSKKKIRLLFKIHLFNNLPISKRKGANH
jgi:hypothetical protein